MRFHVLLLLLLLAGAASICRAQQPSAPVAAQPSAPTESTISIYPKDGPTRTTTGVRRVGTTVMAKIKLDDGGEGEAGYEVANLRKIVFPDPGQLKIASGLLAQGRAEDALKELAPALAYYAPFRDIPGSWWTALALMQLNAYNRLGNDREADAVAAELGQLGAVPPDVQRAILIRRGANLERGGKHQEALTLLEPIARDENAPPQTLPEAWLNMGAADLALGKNKAALVAYLHVPVYVPERALFMAPALLGSSIAYARLDDKTHARESLQQLIAAYPNSREVPEAKDRLEKLSGPEAADPPHR